jgi:hypothetical protein
MGSVELSVLKTEILNAIRATESEETADQARKVYERYRARNGAIYELEGPHPADCCSTEDRKSTSRRRPNMNAKILTFSSHGDTTLLDYDPATADMDEVNRVIAEYEAKTGAQPFDMATGERISKATSEQREVLMVHPIAGG